MGHKYAVSVLSISGVVELSNLELLSEAYCADSDGQNCLINFSSTHNCNLYFMVSLYSQTRQGSSLMADLKQRLLLPQSEAAMAGTRYNVPLINSLVLYVGMQVQLHPSMQGP